jgi:hypothetical protein
VEDKPRNLAAPARESHEHAASNLGHLAEACVAADDIAEIIAPVARVRVAVTADGHPAADQVEADLRDLAAPVERTGARPYVPFLHLERARLSRPRGEETTRRRELAR